MLHANSQGGELANGESWNNAEWNEQSHALVFEFVQLRSCPAIQPLLSYSDPNSSYTFISQTSRSKPVAFTAAADQYRCFFVNMGDRFMNGYLEEQAPRATDPEFSPFIFQRLRDAKGYSTKAVTDCMTSVQHGKATQEFQHLAVRGLLSNLYTARNGRVVTNHLLTLQDSR